MHLSLKGSLIRSPMLNRVGQRLLQLFEGASAAYSLRDLASNIASVVRVRRASDNSEKDFSAADVSSGAMTQWVNGQVVPPLDVRELVDGERTGDLVEAAAAYSLRNLSSSYTGNVVDVRRSSDDAEESFTAAEVADGTLEDWVNTDLGITFETAEPTTNAATVTNASSTGFTYSSSDTSVRGARLPFSQSIPAGATISVTIRTSNKVGGVTPSVRLASNASGKLAASATPSVFTSSANGTQTFVGTTTSTTTSLAFFDNNVGSFDVSDVTINYIKYDGHVSRWYDQSGNNKHATQGTPASQPKIVDGGSLVSGGLSFDGNDTLSVSGDPVITASSSGTYSAFSVQTVATSEGGYLYGNASSSNGSSAYALADKFTITNYFFADLDNIARSSGQNLLSAVYNNGDAGLLVNGAGTMTDAGTYNFSAGTSDFIIGNRNGGSSDATFLTGSIQEIIIYNSDQSDNRTAIEANIGDHYDIDLPSGVDTGYDQVDGFVETWYDQSGNGNDAVQQVSGSQPKIVDAGVYLGGVVFDGVDDFMDFTSGYTATGGSIFIVEDLDSSDTSQAFIGGNSSGYFPLMQSGSSSTSTYIGASVTSDYINGVEQSLTTRGSYYAALCNNSLQVFTALGVTTSVTYTKLGKGGTSGWNCKGAIKELIVYQANQSANRAAIENNINNQYDIY